MKKPFGFSSPSRLGALQLTLQVALAILLFAGLQILATRHNHRLDLTPTKSFVLSPEAKRVAADVDVPVRITVFYNSQESGRARDILDLLEQFQAVSPRITFRLFDLDRSPGLAKRYGVSSYNSGVAEAGGRRVRLRGVDEESITTALLKLSRRHVRTLCFVTGHGERNPYDTDERRGYSEVAKALEQENFRIVAAPTVGEATNCTVLILAGPVRDLLPGEAAALRRRLERGGRVLLLVDPDAPPSVVAFLRELGIEAGNDLIVDERNRFIGWDAFVPRVPTFLDPVIRRNLPSPAVFALARSLRPAKNGAAGVKLSLLALTHPQSWALAGARTPPPDEDVHFRRGRDHPGPLAVGISAVFPARTNGGAPPREGRLIVFGDSDFASNFYVNLLGNKDLFMSTVAALAEDPTLVAVRRKGLPRGSISPIYLTARQGRLIFWVAVVVEPAVFALLGIAVGLRRRRRGGGR